MKKLIFLPLLFIILHSNAQKFITSGTIEFETKTNVPKTITWDGAMSDEIKSKLPTFSTNYYTYTFNNDKSVYKFSRNTDKQKIPEWFKVAQEEDVSYNDYAAKTFVNRREVQNDDIYLITGTIKPIQWKIYPNDNTVIAGFNCRKAGTIMFDSVYIFAYYTDEIKISGGPMGLSGLPGMILGVTIPRMHTSWIATSLQLSADQSAITPPTRGKKTTEDQIKVSLNEMGKRWGKEGQKYLHPAIWKALL